jgi:integral membrane sensor domain MASE1
MKNFFYNLFYYFFDSGDENMFLTDLVDNGPILSLVLCLTLIGIAVCTLFYKGYDHPKYNTIAWWIGSLLVAMILTGLPIGLISYYSLDSYYSSNLPDFPDPSAFSFLLGFFSSFYCLVIYCLLSMVVKFSTINQKNNPI